MTANIEGLIILITGILFFILLFMFTIYGVFLAYHWLNYGTDKKIAQIAIATYLCGGAILLLTLAATLGKI